MSVFIGEKGKRVELAERKDAINPNLLLNSRDFSSNWMIDKATVTSDSYNGGNVVSIHPGGSGDNPVTQAIQTPPSQPVTWSVYAKADNAGDKLHSELWGNSGATNQALTTGWCRYTFNGTFNPTNYSLYFWGVSGNKGDIHIALPKLEKGTVATPWCPAYGDYAWTSDITNLKTAIASAGKVKTVNGTQPDNTGNISIAIPDISGKADKTDVTNLANRVTALEQNSLKIVPITQAAYDALSTKDSNTIYAIGG